MKAINAFLVRPKDEKRYNNEKEVAGKSFITSASQEDHKASTREAVVVSLPLNYSGDVKVGDILIVHHNVFKYYYNMYGVQKSGRSWLKGNLFFVEPDQYFLYGQPGNWKTHGKYCFVEPVPLESTWIYSSQTEQPLVGKLVYSNEELSALGVHEGDTVHFTPESEYEFEIDGKKIYRMFTNNIAAVL